jgi:hypothetical protein
MAPLSSHLVHAAGFAQSWIFYCNHYTIKLWELQVVCDETRPPGNSALIREKYTDSVLHRQNAIGALTFNGNKSTGE